MCIVGNSQVPTAPKVAPAPTVGDVTANATTDSAITTNKNIVARRQGVFGNIKTTPLGDASYGSAAVATFGKKAA